MTHPLTLGWTLRAIFPDTLELEELEICRRAGIFLVLTQMPRSYILSKHPSVDFTRDLQPTYLTYLSVFHHEYSYPACRGIRTREGVG